MRIKECGAIHTQTDVQYQYDARDRLTREVRDATTVTCCAPGRDSARYATLDTPHPDVNRDRCEASVRQRRTAACQGPSRWAGYGLVGLLALTLAACSVPMWQSPNQSRKRQRPVHRTPHGSGGPSPL